MELTEKTVSSELVYKGKVVELRVDDITLPDGRAAKREVVRHNGGVCIAAIDGDEVVMVEQYRYAIGRTTLELCAGKLDTKDEEPFSAALRELREETGLVALDLRPAGTYYATPGFCDEKLHLFVATKFEKTSQELDDGEFLNVRRIPLRQAVEMVLDNRICDGKSKTLLLLAERIMR